LANQKENFPLLKQRKKFGFGGIKNRGESRPYKEGGES